MSAATMLETRMRRVPVERVPLRNTLPQFNPGTVQRLMAFAMAQWDICGPWLLARSAEYWTEHDYPPDVRATEELHERMDATCALDLLVWQSGCAAPKEALAWLGRKEALVEDGVEWGRTVERVKEL